MEFTYYGDLLGISASYNLSPSAAQAKLDNFYETAFSILNNYCHENQDVDVLMFSDSILISGNNHWEIIEQLRKLYINLLIQGLMLRGSIVKGKINFENRRELGNFKKMLPTNNVLAEAHALEQTQKGARFLIHKSLVEKILGQENPWLTQEGYIWNVLEENQEDSNINLSILRKISPTPDNKSYEYLYFITDNMAIEDNCESIKIKLLEMTKMVNIKLAEHYRQTILLLKRCIVRSRYTLNNCNS